MTNDTPILQEPRLPYLKPELVVHGVLEEVTAVPDPSRV